MEFLDGLSMWQLFALMMLVYFIGAGVCAYVVSRANDGINEE